MQITVRTIGNSKGFVLPKSLLVQIGLEDQTTAEITVDIGAIVLRRSAKVVRSGWAQAAKVLAAYGQDAMLMGEFDDAIDAMGLPS